MALEGLSLTHLGTRFWATTSVDKLKTLVTDANAKIGKATKLKSIWAGSSRIGSLAEKGETNRFHNTLGAAKAFPKTLDFTNLSNDRALFGLLGESQNGGSQDDGNAHAELNAYANRLADIFSTKFPQLVEKLPMAKGQDLTSFVQRVVLAVNESVDFTTAAQALLQAGGAGHDDVDNYKTSLANATLGALRMIAEKGLSVNTIYTLGEKKVYDLSRYYDAYEVAWNTLHDAGLLPQDDTRDGVVHFAVGDGSKGTLKSNLKHLAAYLKEKLVDPNWDRNNVAKGTLSLINYCLHMNGREQRLNVFASEAHKVLDKLEAAAGGRKVSFGLSVSASAGADLGSVAKLKIEGKGKYDRGYSLNYGVGGLSVTTSNTLGGSFGATASFGDVPGTEMSSSEIPKKGSGLFGGGLGGTVYGNRTTSSTNVYSETDDYIAASKGHSELVESSRVLGFLRSIKRFVMRQVYALSDLFNKSFEFSQRAFLKTLENGLEAGKGLRARLDGFFARQTVSLTSSRREATSYDVGFNVGGSFHAGLSKGTDKTDGTAKLGESTLIDVSASFARSGSSEGDVVARDYQSVTNRLRSLPGSVNDFRVHAKGLLEQKQETFEAEFESVLRSVDTKKILNYVESDLRKEMKEAEDDLAVAVESARKETGIDKDARAKKVKAAWTTFTQAWNKVAVKFELLRRRMDEILSQNQGQPVEDFAQFDEIVRYMIGRIDRPEIPELPEAEQEVDRYFNIEVAHSKNENKVHTKRTEFSFSASLGSGFGEIVGESGANAIFGEAQSGEPGSILENPAHVLTSEVFSSGVNQGIQAAGEATAFIPSQVGGGVVIETQYPEIVNPAVPWETSKTETVTVTFPTNALTRKIIDFTVEKIVANRVKDAENGSNPVMDEVAKQEAFKSVRKDLYNAIGMTAEELGNKTISELLGKLDLSMDPKLHNFCECLRKGSITFKYEGEKLTSVTNATTCSTTSGFGVDFKLFAFDMNVSVSKTFAETMPTRFLVNEMPIDAVLNRVNLLNPKTRHQSLLGYLAKNPPAAKKLAGEICGDPQDKTVAEREKQAANVLGILYKRLSGNSDSPENQAQMNGVKSLWQNFQNAKENLANQFDGKDVQPVALHTALATYLETLRDIFFYCSTQDVTYATSGSRDEGFKTESRPVPQVEVKQSDSVQIAEPEFDSKAQKAPYEGGELKDFSGTVKTITSKNVQYKVCAQTVKGNTCYGVSLVNAMLSTEKGRKHLLDLREDLLVRTQDVSFPQGLPLAAKKLFNKLQPLEKLFVLESLKHEGYWQDMRYVTDDEAHALPPGFSSDVYGLLGLKTYNPEGLETNQIGAGKLEDQALGSLIQKQINDGKFVVVKFKGHFATVIGYNSQTHKLTLVDSQNDGKVGSVDIAFYNQANTDLSSAAAFEFYEIDENAKPKKEEK